MSELGARASEPGCWGPNPGFISYKLAVATTTVIATDTSHQPCENSENPPRKIFQESKETLCDLGQVTSPLCASVSSGDFEDEAH